MKQLLTFTQGVGLGVFFGASLAVWLGTELGTAVAVGGVVLGVGAFITSQQTGERDGF
jgi:hypothetical protein